MENREKLKSKHLIPAVAVMITAVLLLWIGGAIWGRHGPEFDSDAVDSSQKPLTVEEIQEQIQKEADESGFRFKMNTTPTVRSQSTEPEGDIQIADWTIINSIDNTCDMSVVITGADGTELYKSRQLKPGEQELSGPLEHDLEPGIYDATATASAMDPETGETLGNVTAEIILTVQVGS